MTKTVPFEGHLLNPRLTFGMPLSCHERENGFSVVVGLLLAGCTRVFAIVCQFIHSAQVADSVAAEEKPVRTWMWSVNKNDIKQHKQAPVNN